jgi:HEPN domain-containing protein
MKTLLYVKTETVVQRHSVLALLKAIAVSIPEEIKEVNEGVTYFVRRFGTKTKLYEKRVK